jgi:hypothetical protein
MSNKIAARIEGEVAYTDGTSASFAASIDDDGTVNSAGLSSAMGDIIATVKALFTALGGTLTVSLGTSGKTVSDKTALLNIQGTYGATPATENDFACFAEYSLKTGTIIGSGGAADYATAKTNFNPNIKAMMDAIAGVSTTVA